MADEMFKSSEEDEVLRNDASSSPDVFLLDSGQLPFEKMGDDHFELLLADIYMEKVNTGEEDWFDTARRLNDGADQGRDIILFKENRVVGVIQCKCYKSNVGMSEFIKEMCKYFLYAKIYPAIGPDPHADFKYCVAVASGVTGDLFNFLTSNGRKRFEDLRSEFMDGAIKVRDRYKSLRDHCDLASLNREQLCDIVWERIDNLKTDLHKKDDLSRIVAGCPHIKSRYFKLESDLQLQMRLQVSLAFSNAEVNEEERKILSAVRTEYIDRRLESNERINVGLIQGSDFLATLKGMVEPTEGPLVTNFGSRPALIAAGATAVTPADWEELNELIKSYAYPLVISVGCGDVLGSTLLDWISSDEMIWIDESLKHPPASRKFKAGWCWVTDPDEGVFSCYILVESEPIDPNYDRGSLALRLAFEDVIVWPTLTDGFINRHSYANSQVRRIIASQTEDKKNRRNIVLASIDVINLEDVLKSVSNYPSRSSESTVAIIVANSERVNGCEAGFYSATGVFPASEVEDVTRCSPPAVQPPCRVMRRADNGALTFTINCRSNLVLQHVMGHRLVREDLRNELPPTTLEFHELFERHPPVCGYTESVRKELDELDMLVQQEVFVEPTRFIYLTKHGVKRDEAFSLRDLTNSGGEIMEAIQALCYVKSHRCAEWVVEPDVNAHIQIGAEVDSKIGVIAWANRSYHVRQMLGDLYEWSNRNAGHPTTLIFASAMGLVKDAKPDHNRYDFTSPPPVERSILEAAPPQGVYMFDIREIESLYDDEGAISVEQFMEAIESRRRLLDAG